MNTMKRILVAIVAVLALAAPAHAYHPAGWHVPTRNVVIDGYVQHLGAVLADYESTGLFTFSFVNPGMTYECGNNSLLALQSVGPGTVRICRATGGLYAQVAVDWQYHVEKGVAVVQGGNRQSVCHELGHVLGLGHSNSGGSCMKTFSSAGTINAHDREQLASVYGHSH